MNIDNLRNLVNAVNEKECILTITALAKAIELKQQPGEPIFEYWNRVKRTANEMLPKHNKGGKREGAGRPSTTRPVVMRVPKALEDTVKQMIKEYKASL